MKKDYMTRLEWAARWRLPRQEMEEVISDYREIVADEELRQGLGKPRDVIRPLVQKRGYYTWLGVFAVMAGCILALGISPMLFGYPLWRLLFDHWYGYGGAAISLVGAFGLVKARMGDRRWAAVYILAMAAILAGFSVVHMTGWMGAFGTPGEMFRLMLTQCAVITVLGLLGTGVALC